jgi:hypothetical protein
MEKDQVSLETSNMPSTEVFYLTLLEPSRPFCSANSNWSSKLPSVQLLLEALVNEDEHYL